MDIRGFYFKRKIINTSYYIAIFLLSEVSFYLSIAMLVSLHSIVRVNEYYTVVSLVAFWLFPAFLQGMLNTFNHSVLIHQSICEVRVNSFDLFSFRRPIFRMRSVYFQTEYSYKLCMPRTIIHATCLISSIAMIIYYCLFYGSCTGSCTVFAQSCLLALGIYFCFLNLENILPGK